MHPPSDLRGFRYVQVVRQVQIRLLEVPALPVGDHLECEHDNREDQESPEEPEQRPALARLVALRGESPPQEQPLLDGTEQRPQCCRQPSNAADSPMGLEQQDPGELLRVLPSVLVHRPESSGAGAVDLDDRVVRVLHRHHHRRAISDFLRPPGGKIQA